MLVRTIEGGTFMRSKPCQWLVHGCWVAGLIVLLAGAMGGCRSPGTGPDDSDEVTESTSLEGYQVFPTDNPWNQDISGLPVHPNSANYIASIGLDTGLHPDFGTVWHDAPIGFPYVVVHTGEPLISVTFTEFGDESDPGPYPIPLTAGVEGGS